MKRHNQTKTCILPCYLTWALMSVLSILCFLSCACRNKISSTSPPSAEIPSTTHNGNQSNNAFTPDSILHTQYGNIIKAVRAKEGYSLFGEFLERGQFSNILMRLDMMKYIILVPSDVSLKNLDNPTLTQLIYPDVPNQSNLNFLFQHVAFASATKDVRTATRTMANKIITIDSEHKKLIIDGKEISVKDEAELPPSITLYFIDHFLN